MVGCAKGETYCADWDLSVVLREDGAREKG